MNYSVSINGVLLAKVEYLVTRDGHLHLGFAPGQLAQIYVGVEGWTQGFVGDGVTNKFPLSPEIQELIRSDTELVRLQSILFEAMKNLDNATVRSEVDRLETVLAMTRNYDTNQIGI